MQTYKDADQAKVDGMKKELIEKYPAQEKLYDTASDEAVQEAHKAMKDEKSTSIEGLAGAGSDVKKNEEFSCFNGKKAGEGQ